MLRKSFLLIFLVFAMAFITVEAMAAPSVTIQVPTDGAILPGPCPAQTPIKGVASVDTVAKKLDIVFIIDTSGSMGTTDGPGGMTRLAAVKQAATNVLDNFDSSVINVGVVQFTTTASIEQNLTNDYDAVRDAIDNLQIGNWTAMGDGIGKAIEEYNNNGRSDAEWIALLLSDGWSNTGSDPSTQAQNAANAGITINTYGFGSPDEDTLEDIADLTGGTYTYVDTSNIDNIFDPGTGSGVNLDRVELTDGTNTWNATITSQIGNVWTWQSPNLGTVYATGTTFTATAYFSDQSYATDSVTVYCGSTAPIPEPTTMLLLGSGLIGLAGIGRRKMKK